jgi:hypothetical protein
VVCLEQERPSKLFKFGHANGPLRNLLTFFVRSATFAQKRKRVLHRERPCQPVVKEKLVLNENCVANEIHRPPFKMRRGL